MEYVTPERLRATGLGTTLPESDLELRTLIRIASGLVNRECAAPQSHDFRGGVVINEQHSWDIGNDHVMGQRRVYPYHRPVTSIERFEIRVTPGGSGVVPFTPNSIYLNTTEGYVELVSLSLTTASVYAAGLIPNLGLTVPTAELDYTYGGTGYSFTDEVMAASSGNTVYYAEELYWTDDEPLVMVNGVATTSGWTANLESGSITFDDALEDEDLVTISAASRLHPNIVYATSLIASDLVAQAALNAGGMQGLSGLKVLEVELRQSRSGGFLSTPINPAAAALLQPFRYRSFA